MLGYVAQRLAQGAVVIVLVSVATFGILHLAPGDPIDVLIGESGRTQLTSAQIATIRHTWGLDRPWYEQYLTWAGNMVRGDFGESVIRTGMPVGKMLQQAAPVTITLNLAALAVAILIAIPCGIVAGLRQGSVADHAGMVASTLGVAVPNFWIALVLIIVFALKLRWLPPFGLESWQGYILPVAVLATEQTAVLARLMRGKVIEELRQDFVRTAWSKGLRRSAVVLRHVVRNALLPVVTVVGHRVAYLLSGAVIVETVFAIPGIGRLFTDSVYHLDYQVVQAVVLLASVVVVATNLATDLAYMLIDPRIRMG